MKSNMMRKRTAVCPLQTYFPVKTVIDRIHRPRPACGSASCSALGLCFWGALCEEPFSRSGHFEWPRALWDLRERCPDHFVVATGVRIRADASRTEPWISAFFRCWIDHQGLRGYSLRVAARRRTPCTRMSRRLARKCGTSNEVGVANWVHALIITASPVTGPCLAAHWTRLAPLAFAYAKLFSSSHEPSSTSFGSFLGLDFDTHATVLQIHPSSKSMQHPWFLAILMSYPAVFGHQVIFVPIKSLQKKHGLSETQTLELSGTHQKEWKLFF